MAAKTINLIRAEGIGALLAERRSLEEEMSRFNEEALLAFRAYEQKVNALNELRLVNIEKTISLDHAIDAVLQNTQIITQA